MREHIRKIETTDSCYIPEDILDYDNSYVLVGTNGDIDGYFELTDVEELRGDGLTDKVNKKLKEYRGNMKHLGYIESFKKGTARKMIDYIFTNLQVDVLLLEAKDDAKSYFNRINAVELKGCNCTIRPDMARMVLTKGDFMMSNNGYIKGTAKIPGINLNSFSSFK